MPAGLRYGLQNVRQKSRFVPAGAIRQVPGRYERGVRFQQQAFVRDQRQEVQQMAAAEKVKMPFGEYILDMLEQAKASEHGGKDMSAMYLFVKDLQK